ncbi:MAG: hypothetical protein AAF385_06925 [Pseudomonadota bacterium]
MAKKALIALAILFSFSSVSIAQSGDSASYKQERPTRGMTKSAVERNFGAPQVKRAAVGDPPISRWEYQGFIVYFEYNHVIHAVYRRG